MDERHELRLLPYHEALIHFLKREEPEVWAWYASHQTQAQHAESVRFDLLKSTYRLERDSQPELYETAQQVASVLALDVPLTIYQSQNPHGMNASLAPLLEEAHLILHGPVAEKLNADELRALIGHELSHLQLWTGWDREPLIADQILSALTKDACAQVAHFESARLFALFTEIFCDRGAFRVLDDLLVIVSMLVKVTTQVDTVDAESYLRQAEEILAREPGGSEEATHPELFLRARAIQLFGQDGLSANQAIASLIEGKLSLERLDLLSQDRVARWTRQLMDQILSPAWMRSDLVMAHARQFFDDYEPAAEPEIDPALKDVWSDPDPTMRDYFCFLLLDFMTIDRDLEELPVAHALRLAEKWGFKTRLKELTCREMRLRKKQLDRIDNEKAALLENATGASGP